MSREVDVPEEAVRILAQSLWWAEHDYGQAPGADWGDVGGERRERAYDRARFALREAAPIIRQQEQAKVGDAIEQAERKGRQQGRSQERQRARDMLEERVSEHEARARSEPVARAAERHRAKATALRDASAALDSLEAEDD